MLILSYMYSPIDMQMCLMNGRDNKEKNKHQYNGLLLGKRIWGKIRMLGRLQAMHINNTLQNFLSLLRKTNLQKGILSHLAQSLDKGTKPASE